MFLAYDYGEIIQSCLPHLQTPNEFKAMGITFLFGKYFLRQNDENTTLIGNFDLNHLSHFRLKCKIECISLTVVIKNMYPR